MVYLRGVQSDPHGAGFGSSVWFGTCGSGESERHVRTEELPRTGRHLSSAGLAHDPGALQRLAAHAEDLGL